MKKSIIYALFISTLISLCGCAYNQHDNSAKPINQESYTQPSPSPSTTTSSSSTIESSKLKEKATLTTDEVTKLMQKFPELEGSAYADMTNESGFYIFFRFNAIDGRGAATTWTVNPSNGDVYNLSGKVILNLLITPTTEPTSVGNITNNSNSSSNNTSISTKSPSSTQDIQGTEMNLTQIQTGNYSSLLGTWTEVAYAGNYYDGTGVQWKTGSISTLTVSSDKIVLNDLVIQGNTLKDSAGSHTLEFEINGGSLDASLKDQSVAINWAVYFYPKGVKNDLEPNNGVKIDNTKNLIVIWSSNMNQTVVFAQTK